MDPRRVALGYDYCLKEDCQRRYMHRVRLAAVGVNKAADYYTTAEEVLPPPGPSARPRADEADAEPPAPTTRRRAAAAPRSRSSTLDKLREKERALDAALEATYQRFRAGQITAKEMDRERRRLTTEFNTLVRSENIRYRGMLRSLPGRSK